MRKLRRSARTAIQVGSILVGYIIGDITRGTMSKYTPYIVSILLIAVIVLLLPSLIARIRESQIPAGRE